MDEFSAGSAPFHAGYGADFIVPDSFLFLFGLISLGLEDDAQDIFDSALGAAYMTAGSTSGAIVASGIIHKNLLLTKESTRQPGWQSCAVGL